MTGRKNNIYRLTIGGLLLAVGIIIPRMFHLFGTAEAGKIFQPMHISVFIAGIYLGPLYGTIIGFMTPMLVSLISGMPMFPFNLIMALELAAYGLFAGLFIYLLKKSRIKWIGKTVSLYISLIISMIAGRIINAIVLYVMSELFKMKVPAPITVWGAAITGIPGIILQLLIVPVIILALYKEEDRHKI